MKSPVHLNDNQKAHLKSGGLGLAFAAAAIAAEVGVSLLGGPGWMGSLGVMVGGTILMNKNTRFRPSRPITTMVTAVVGGVLLPRLAMAFISAASPQHGANDTTPARDPVALVAPQAATATGPA